MAQVISLQDDFNDNSRDVTKWPNAYTSAATFAETGGTMVVTLAASTAGSNYSGYNTAPNTYDLTGNSMTVQMAGVPSGANCQVIIKAYIDGNNILYWQINNTSLVAVKVVAAASTNILSTTYSLTTHKYLRIRESGGITYWETSPDGRFFTAFTSQSNPIAVTGLTLEISAGTFGSQVTPGTATFDNFNINELTVAPGTQNFSNQAVKRASLF